MSDEKRRPAGRWQRALPLAAAAAALCVTLGPALFSRARVSAQGSGSGRATAATGGRARAGVMPVSAPQAGAAREIAQSPEVALAFENATDAPVVFTEARMRVITRELYGRAGGDVEDSAEGASLYATLPTATLLNVSGKRVREVGFGFVRPDGRVPVITGRAASLPPGETQTFASEWGRRNVVMPGDASELRIRLVWAVFEDGTSWGAKPPAPPAPPAPPVPPAPPAPGAQGYGRQANAPPPPAAPEAPEPPAAARGAGGETP